MRIIGLTGGIACGKSNISDMLSSLGCTVIDGDKLSRELTVPGGEALPALRNAFGPSVFRSDGTLDRKALGALVFSDRNALQALDGIMQPLLLEKIRRRIGEERLKGTEICVLDMPLLFEKKLDVLCDTVWCAWLPAETQLSRLTARDGLDRTRAMQRIESQMPVDEKAARSAVVISTEGSIEETRAKIPPLLEAERSRLPKPAAGPDLNPVRRRRSERYSETVSSETVPPVSSGTSPNRRSSRAEGSPVTEPQTGGQASRRETVARSPRTDVPGVMERPSAGNARSRKQEAEWRMPAWLQTSLIVCFFLLLAAVTSTLLMKGYLKQEADRREAAYQRVLSNHPLASCRESIEKYAAEFNLQPAYVAAIIMNESSFRTTAESSVGARGLMQLMPDTAEWIAHKLHVDGYSFDRMYDADSNIRFGCWYLNYLSGLFRGDPVCVTAAYHAGQGQVTTWLSDPEKSKDGITLDPDALGDGPTKTYIGRVTQDYGIYKALYFTEDPQPAADADPSAAVVAD